MPNPAQPQPEVIITAVQFGDEGIEISYFEKRDQGSKVGIFKNMVLATTGIEEQIEEIVQGLEEIVDHGLVTLRNPPKRISGARERILSGEDDKDSTDAD